MTRKGSLKPTIEYLAARALIGGMGVLPRRLAVASGKAVGRIGYSIIGDLRRIGRRNLEIAFPEIDERERERFLRGCFSSMGRMLGEFSQFRRMTRESVREMIEMDPVGLANFREVENQKRGVIFLTAHLGSWEMLSFGWSAIEYPISFLVRPLDNPRVEEMVESIRTRFGNRAIDKKMAARTALKTLREGGTLGILADLNTQTREGVFVPFFGKLACTTTGVATLALRTDAVVVPACAVWNDAKGKYYFHGEPHVELVRTGDDATDIQVNTANFTAAIEQMIRKYPDQYLWVHRRWKTRPPGEEDVYQKR